jgi:hypothetical protein
MFITLLILFYPLKFKKFELLLLFIYIYIYVELVVKSHFYLKTVIFLFKSAQAQHFYNNLTDFY